MTADQMDRQTMALESIAGSLVKIVLHLEETGGMRQVEPPRLPPRLDTEVKHLRK